MLKFYLENDVPKAVEYGTELLDDIGNLLQEPSHQDLRFSVATAHSL